MARRTSQPPVPARRPTVLTHHGRQRVDDWYWLRDRDDPEVLDHLRAENAFTEATLAAQRALRRRLYAEIRSRIAETDLSVPVRRGPWWYYSRTTRGRSYATHCRRPATRGQKPPLRPRRDAAEEVLLDENELAQGHEFLQVGTFAVSPDHGWLAYGVDTSGAERYELRFRRLGSTDGAGEVTEVIPDTYYGLAWAGDSDTVFYTRVDDAMRPYQLWRHVLGTDPAADKLVLEEPDAQYTLSTGRTRSGDYVVVALHSTDTSEVWLIPTGDPMAAPRCVQPRRHGVEYAVDHLREDDGSPPWLVKLTNEEARDFRLLAAPDQPGPGAPAAWREVVGHREGTRLDDVDLFDRWLVLSERSGGEAGIRVAPLRRDGAADPFGEDLLERSWVVPAHEHPSTTWAGPNLEPDQEELRFEQTSLVSPRAVYDLPLTRRTPVLRKRQRVRGGYTESAYRTGRLWARSADGTAVPVSVLHRVELLEDPGAPEATPPAAPAPLLLYGYGAYEHSIDPAFSSLRLNLVDRGFVFAIAHVRGGGELGRRWYEDGRREVKQHTFDDFLAVARHLVAQGFTTPDQLAARGGSAGGLLIGAVLNQAPELFRAAVAEVPFVDCLTTMLDASLPLTVGEWEEWGNPEASSAAYDVIGRYSPYDNVGPARYPDLLATAGLEDNRVGFWEPAKWVARLRAANPANRVLLRVELGAGHGGPSGRYDAWKDEALVQAFLLDALGMADVELMPRPASAAG